MRLLLELKRFLSNPFFSALLSGILLAFSFPVYHIHYLAWGALLPLLFVASKEPRAGRNALLFFIAGAAFHLILLQWLLANIFWAGGWAVLGYLGMCVALSLYWALLGSLWAHLRRAWPGVLGLLSLVPLWVSMEYLQARLFTGFGWGALAYTQTANLPVLQWAAYGGMGLLGALLILSNLLLLLFLQRRGRARLIVGCVFLGLLLLVNGGGSFLLENPMPNPAQKPLQVGLYQSNYSQEMKWDRDYTQHMVDKAADYTRRLATHVPQPDLVVWPEALVMNDYEDPEHFQAMQQAAMDADVYLFTGATREQYNSSVLLNPDGEVVDVYDKVHLAPFGEYVPLEKFLPFLRQMVPGGGLLHGEEQKLLPVESWNMGPLICFEVLFAPMAAHLRAEGADFLTVITNLAWFGGSNAVLQELEIARMRAVETRLPLVHVANTGISGVFDPWGRFTPINLIWEAESQAWREWDPEAIQPQNLLMRRAAGVIPLPEKASHPFAWGTTVFNYSMLALSVVALAFWGRARLRPKAKDAGND